FVFLAGILSCVASGVARRPSWVAREELDQQTIDLGRVLVRRPVAGGGNPVQVEAAHGLADLADQKRRGAKDRVVSLAPQQADLALEMREIIQQRAAAAHLATVEARAADVVDLDVQQG